MTIELEVYEAIECIEALEQSVRSMKEVLKGIAPSEELTINAIKKVITNQEELAATLQARVWEEN
jgi:hypothetical protein